MATASLSKFLRLEKQRSLALCLPRFTGAQLPTGDLSYSGFVHADRDVRSAHHIDELVRGTKATVEIVTPEEAIAALTQRDRSQTLFIFGSRSNAALSTVVTKSRLSELVKFSFDDKWSIRTREDKTYSLRDPSKMNQKAYTAATDYGVVAGLLDDENPPIFVVAGLGGRATEGCGQYLRNNWLGIADRAKGRSFAVLLEFPPPVAPELCAEVEFMRLN